MAAYALSLKYEKGDGVAVDRQKEVAYLKQAAEAGLGIAAYRLGGYYFMGQAGLPRDENAANEWFYKSAEDGYFLGKYRYGMTVQRLSTKPEDADQAKVWVQGAVDQATPNELLQLCESLRMGSDGLRDSTAARNVCSKSASAGNAAAMVEYGILLVDGAGGDQDYTEARTWFEKAAAAGRADAMNDRGVLSEHGWGGDKDLDDARKWFEKSANGNDPDGTNSLGFMFEKGWGGPRDKEEAGRLYRKAVDLGEKQFAAQSLTRLDGTSKIRYPILYANAINEAATRDDATRDSAVENASARTATKTAASEAPATTTAVAEAPAAPSESAPTAAPSDTAPKVAANDRPPSEALKSCDLAAASVYDKQRPSDVPGVPTNGAFKAAVAIPACEAAVRAAPQDARMLYQLGRGYRAVGRLSEAAPLYQQAAQLGNALAATDLAGMYERGEGVEADPKAQLFYLDQAARTGFAMAEYNYGVLYNHGSAALPKDQATGRQLIAAAAQGNFPPAMTTLALMLQSGLGGNKDEVEARYWFEKGAEAGNYRAMDGFGFYLQTGKGGPKDLVEARKWFEKSASGNDPDGMNSLGVMFEHGWGGPKDLEEARRQYRKAIALGEKKFAAKNLAKLDAAASQ